MSVSNNQPVNAEVCNAAYVSKTADSTIIGEITLNNPDSGAQVDLQRDINALKTAKDANETAITQLNNDVDAIEADIVDINNELAGISSGGGVGSSAIYAFFDAEKSDLTDFTNISIETTEPISKVQSYSVDAYPATFPVVTLDKRRINASHGSCSFVYTLASGTFKAKVVDDLANVLSEIELGANEAKRVVLEWKPHNTQVSYQLITEDVASATGLKIDDVEFSDASKEIKNFSVKNSISLADNGGQTITATDNLMFNGTGLGWDAVANDYELQYDASTILIKGNIAYNSAGTDLYADLYVNGTLHKAITSIQGTNGSYVQFTYISERGEFNRGDKISIRAKAGTLATGLPFSHYMIINEDSISDGTVYAGGENKSDILAEYSNNSGEVLGTGDNIPWATQGVDTASAWTGSSYNIKETGIWSFFGQVALNTTNNYEIYLYVNNVFKATISKVNSASSVPFGFTGHFNEGQSVSFRLSTGATLNNASSHRIYISKQAVNIDNYIIENPQGEFKSVKYALSSSLVNTSQVDIADLRASLEVGESYLVVGAVQTRVESTTDRAFIEFKQGGVRIDEAVFGAEGGPSSLHYNYGAIAFDFTATHDTLTVDSAMQGGNSVIYGGSFYKLIKLPKALGVDLAKQVVTNHVLGGVEYEVKGKLWDGKQVYARSFETTVSMTPSSDHVLATTVTGLDIIEIKGSGYASPSWYNLNGTASSGEAYIRYQDSTGNITTRNDATTFTKQRFTIEYV